MASIMRLSRNYFKMQVLLAPKLHTLDGGVVLDFWVKEINKELMGTNDDEKRKLGNWATGGGSTMPTLFRVTANGRPFQARIFRVEYE